MLASSESSSDVLGLARDGQCDDNSFNVLASKKVVDTLASLPDPAAVSRLTEAVEREW